MAQGSRKSRRLSCAGGLPSSGTSTHSSLALFCGDEPTSCEWMLLQGFRSPHHAREACPDAAGARGSHQTPEFPALPQLVTAPELTRYNSSFVWLCFDLQMPVLLGRGHFCYFIDLFPKQPPPVSVPRQSRSSLSTHACKRSHSTPFRSSSSLCRDHPLRPLAQRILLTCLHLRRQGSAWRDSFVTADQSWKKEEMETVPTTHPALPSPSSYLHSASSVLMFPAAALFCSDEKSALTPQKPQKLVCKYVLCPDWWCAISFN